MTKRDAEQLGHEIDRTPGMEVTGTRYYGRGSYALDVVDRRTGYTFVVNNRADWEERLLQQEPLR